MGTSLEIGCLDITIPADKREAALQAINAYEYTDYNGHPFGIQDAPFQSLTDAFANWGFWSADDENGDFYLDSSEAYKWYEDIEHLFEAVGPYVTAGSIVDLIIEYDGYERYYFDGGCMQTLAGTLVFEDPETHTHTGDTHADPQ